MILIDFSPLKTGGGVQLALNFLLKIAKTEDAKGYIFLFPDAGPLYELDKSSLGINYKISPSSFPISRYLFEQNNLQKIFNQFKIHTIYTFFGPGLPHPKSIKSIVSVAYPIICNDDSPYWKYIPIKEKLKKKLINFFRIQRLKKADVILAETEVMQKRLSKTLKRSLESIYVFPPSPTEFLANQNFTGLGKDPVKFLFLSGFDHHKNLWRLLELAEELESNKLNFQFLLTGNLSNFKKMKHSIRFNENLVEQRFVFLGRLHPTNLNKIYQECSFLVNLSDLESFSNNYMEAWKTATPLVVSDRDFARFICKNSALYVEPHDIRACALKILNHITDEKEIYKMVLEGQKLLSELPSQEEKLNQIFKLIHDYSS